MIRILGERQVFVLMIGDWRNQMRTFRFRILLFLLLLVGLVLQIRADQVHFVQGKSNGKQEFRLINERLRCTILFDNNKLISETIEAQGEWLTRFQTSSLAFKTNADFMVDILWTGWKAPQRMNNADNLLKLTKENFQLKNNFLRKLPGGSIELIFLLKGLKNPFELQIRYQLQPESFYFRRRIAIRESEKGHHFLRWFWPRWGHLLGDVSIVKPGNFGQPMAVRIGEGGAFFGLEYPTAENILMPSERKKAELRCGQEVGKKIEPSWLNSEWVVVGLSPNASIKKWFWKYVDKIRVAPLKPYLLYNCWYDLRAPEMVKDPTRAMIEENVLQTIASFKKRLFEERGLNLDAFVLDDGWDVYRSDWVLNKDQFPNGLSPLAEALQSMMTELGLWLGPSGGYSHRDWRVEWMKDHGYEVVGDQMCVAGGSYHKLLKKRLTNFVRSENISYYKWDGIQFTCNEVEHGHLPDIYSRRAVMESVIDLSRAVRAENPEVFLNITSGTWLSPWWLKYANIIWMQGYDYGYANVPSISRRDRAMTYRDSVLYDDLIKLDFWFPIANLMTHGIIKGYLQKIGGEEEPLEKFTDNAVLYFARGISMWELYISPDLLSDREWDILAGAIRWAKDRFPVLCSTEMIGGDPDERKAYGYVHFLGKKGIVAVRNPYIEPQTLRFSLSELLGLDPDADALVLERIYPNRWVSPQLYSSGSEIKISLPGYETAIYEIYPLREAKVPLLAGRIYELSKKNEREFILKFYDGEEEARLLNHEKVEFLKFQDKTLNPETWSVPGHPVSKRVENVSMRSSQYKGRASLDISFTLKEPIKKAVLDILLEPEEVSLDKKDPSVKIFLDGEKSEPKLEQQKGRWTWHMIRVQPGRHSIKMLINPAQGGEKWKGWASAWVICYEKPQGREFLLKVKQNSEKKKVLLPRPFAEGERRRHIKLGQVKVKL